MKNRINERFKALVAQDMAVQARQVEILAILVFVFLLSVCWLLWNFPLAIQAQPGTAKTQMNIFQLLLAK